MERTYSFYCRALRWSVAALLLLVTSVAANAYDFKVDGICYNILSSSLRACAVTSNSSRPYSGNVVIPETVKYSGTTYTVTSIGKCAFSGCSGLTEITIPNSVTTIGEYAFEYCSGLTSITIPNSVTEIGNYAFYWCTDLTSLTIGNSVTTIGSNAFYNCKRLTSLTIGNSVTKILRSAFSFCSKLTSIYSLNPEPPTCSSTGNGSISYYGVFHNVNKSSCTLYVPTGSKEAYSTAYAWDDFLNIIEIEVDAVADITINDKAEATGYYTTDGKQVSTMQRGINIIRYSDGTAHKVLAK